MNDVFIELTGWDLLIGLAVYVVVLVAVGFVRAALRDR